MTDHGVFSVFNVYAPNTSGGKRLGFRLRYLAALRKAMCEQRKRTNRPVILVGDLNLKARAVIDRQWSRSLIDINRLVALGHQPEPLGWAVQLASIANHCSQQQPIANALRSNLKWTWAPPFLLPFNVCGCMRLCGLGEVGELWLSATA